MISLLHRFARSFSGRRLVLTIGASLLVLVLVACGGEAGDDAGSAGAEAEPTTVADAPTPRIDPDPTPTEAPPNPTPTPGESSGQEATPTPEEESEEPEETPTPQATSTPEPEPLDIPSSAFLPDMTHMRQTFNNCSAASVCMLLSHYDIVMDQESLRSVMRPNEGARHGKTDYMIQFFEEQGFRAHLVFGGDIEKVKAFLAHDIPVIAQQWLELEADPVGHYRVIRGYDDDEGVFRVNDSMAERGDTWISYDDFNEMWRAFSYRFIPVYPPEDDEIASRILGDEMDRQTNRERAVERLREKVDERPEDAQLWYGLGSSLFEVGRYEEAIEAYEYAASIGLPPKMLWYVYWPAEAYNNLGRHEQAVQVAEQQIASAQTFGDMRFQRARAYEEMGETNLAIAEYRQALVDDPRLSDAEEALERLGAR